METTDSCVLILEFGAFYEGYKATEDSILKLNFAMKG